MERHNNIVRAIQLFQTKIRICHAIRNISLAIHHGHTEKNIIKSTLKLINLLSNNIQFIANDQAFMLMLREAFSTNNSFNVAGVEFYGFNLIDEINNMINKLNNNERLFIIDFCTNKLVITNLLNEENLDWDRILNSVNLDQCNYNDFINLFINVINISIFDLDDFNIGQYMLNLATRLFSDKHLTPVLSTEQGREALLTFLHILSRYDTRGTISNIQTINPNIIKEINNLKGLDDFKKQIQGFINNNDFSYQDIHINVVNNVHNFNIHGDVNGDVNGIQYNSQEEAQQQEPMQLIQRLAQHLTQEQLLQQIQQLQQMLTLPQRQQVESIQLIPQVLPQGQVIQLKQPLHIVQNVVLNEVPENGTQFILQPFVDAVPVIVQNPTGAVQQMIPMFFYNIVNMNNPVIEQHINEIEVEEVEEIEEIANEVEEVENEINNELFQNLNLLLEIGEELENEHEHQNMQ